jgi:ribosomal protein L12E/L44/L45/RPP1/RPP2
MAKTEETALAKAGSFELTTLGGNIKEIMSEEMDGLGGLQFDYVKIPSGGGLSFELPGEDEDHPETVQTLTGIIIYHHAQNSYWRDEYNGGNEQPDCSSTNGHVGIDRISGEIRSCDDCPFNQFGSSAKGGNGKACKNGHALYLLRSGDPLPIILQLPPTSIKALSNYIAKSFVLHGKRSYQGITEITLKRMTNADGIKYSAAQFRKAADIADASQLDALAKMAEEIAEISAKAPAAPSDAAPAAQGDGFVEVDENTQQEELPFK